MDAASGLHTISDGLRRNASRITAIVDKLLAISALLRRIHVEEGDWNYGLPFDQIHEDLITTFRTLNFTLDDIFDVFVDVRDRPEHMVWEDLQHRLELEGSLTLIERLRLYHDFFDIQFRILKCQEVADLEPLRQSMYDLLNAQERARSYSRLSLPRPQRLSRPPIYRMETPISPSIYSDDWDIEYLNRARGPAPEPPQPLSPTYTSGSSQTMASSRTSYSGGAYSLAPVPSIPIHWSLQVFDGRHSTTEYQPAFRSNERSMCYGQIEPDALRNLALDEFQPALRVAFDEETLSVQFFWRPRDQRARILVSVQDQYGHLAHYCRPLNDLKIIRDRSTLQLCRARPDTLQYTLWARLNFYFHERMVLFYSTFAAMKRQDQRAVIHQQLTDGFGLESEHGEECQFSGQIQHGKMFHAVRLFRDRGSGVVRLEVAALRGRFELSRRLMRRSNRSDRRHKLTFRLSTGSKKDLALWTAFVTKYTNDPDWAAIERGVVCLSAFRPPPYVFAANYEPPRDRYGHYVLPFTTNSGTLTAV